VLTGGFSAVASSFLMRIQLVGLFFTASLFADTTQEFAPIEPHLDAFAAQGIVSQHGLTLHSKSFLSRDDAVEKGCRLVSGWD
jgi:hypothetical protein